MKILLLRLFFLLILVFFEFSFLDILIPGVVAPLFILTSIVAWVLIVGFPQALSRTLPLTVFFDIVATGMPGMLTLYGIFLSYTTSFLSRRLFVEHRGIGMLVYALFAGFGTLGYAFLNMVFFQPGFRIIFPPAFLLPDMFSFSLLFFSFALSLLLFVLAYQIIKRFEGYAGSLTQQEFLKVK